MNFTMPTTKSQMYETLNEIFLHYRMSRPEYEEYTPTPLSLTQMTFVELNDTQLLEKATNILKPSQEREMLKRKEKLKEKLDNVKTLLENARISLNKEIEEIKKEYKNIESEAKKQAIKNGVEGSEIFAQKLLEIGREKAEVLANKNAYYGGLISTYTTSKTELEEEIDDVEDYFEDLFADEINAKFIELKKEQEEKKVEAFKYNNSIAEKEMRYVNTLEQERATLLLKYIEIQSTELSKNQLIALGYYSDVISCVCGYYNTLSDASAYADIKNEGKLAIYLQDYYEEVITLYKIRANG